MVFGTFLVASLLGGLKQLFVMIQIFRVAEILQAVPFIHLIIGGLQILQILDIELVA